MEHRQKLVETLTFWVQEQFQAFIISPESEAEASDTPAESGVGYGEFETRIDGELELFRRKLLCLCRPEFDPSALQDLDFWHKTLNF